MCCRSGKICPDTSVRLCVPCHMRVVRQTGATVVVDRPKLQTTADRRPPIVRIAWVAAGQGACRCETPAAGGANKPSPLRLVGWRAALHGGSPRGRARAYAIGRRALPTCEGHRGAGLSAKLRPTGDPSRLLHLLSMGPQIAGGKPMITVRRRRRYRASSGQRRRIVCCDVERKIGPTPPLVRLCVPCHMRGHRGGRPRIGNGSGPAAADCSHCLGCVRGRAHRR